MSDSTAKPRTGWGVEIAIGLEQGGGWRSVVIGLPVPAGSPITTQSRSPPPTLFVVSSNSLANTQGGAGSRTTSCSDNSERQASTSCGTTWPHLSWQQQCSAQTTAALSATPQTTPLNSVPCAMCADSSHSNKKQASA